MDSRGPAPPPPGFLPPPGGAPVEIQPMGMPTPMMPPNPGYPPPPAMVVPPYGAGDHMQSPPPQPPPTTGGWSQQNPTCPSGLEYLMPLDNLFVNQKVELLEAFVGWETQNKYSVVNIRGDTVYHVVEESGIIGRMCMGSHRACEFHVFDMNRREVLRMTRPVRCSSCCCFCCLQELQVYSGQTLLGSVVQDWSMWRPSFTIRDNLDNEVLCIKGPWLRYCFDVSFEIRSLDNEHRVGIIAKRWSGLAREFFTDTDVFGMSFPLDLDVKIKAVLLGACLLIDFMYFESSGKQI